MLQALGRLRISRGLGGAKVAVKRRGSSVQDQAAVRAGTKMALDLYLNRRRKFSL